MSGITELDELERVQLAADTLELSTLFEDQIVLEAATTAKILRSLALRAEGMLDTIGSRTVAFSVIADTVNGWVDAVKLADLIITREGPDWVKGDVEKLKRGQVVRYRKRDMGYQGPVFGFGEDMRIELDLISPQLRWLETRGWTLYVLKSDILTTETRTP